MHRYLIVVFAFLAPLNALQAAGVDCELNRNTLVPVPGGYEVRFTPGCEPPPLRAQGDSPQQPAQRETPTFAGGSASALMHLPTVRGEGQPYAREGRTCIGVCNGVIGTAADNPRDQAEKSDAGRTGARPRLRFRRR